MMWTKIHDVSKRVGFAIGFIAIGAAGQSMIDQAAQIPAIQRQADDDASLKNDVIPKLASVAGCQTKRAKIAMGEEAPNGDISSIPNCLDPSSVIGKASKK